MGVEEKATARGAGLPAALEAAAGQAPSPAGALLARWAASQGRGELVELGAVNA